jgi:hypothetical protein
LLRKYDIRVETSFVNQPMASDRKTKTLEVMIPSSQTAVLANMASQRGINTVSMAASILCAALDTHPDITNHPQEPAANASTRPTRQLAKRRRQRP